MDVTKTETALVALVEANPTLVLIDDKKFEDFYEHVKAEARAMPVDLSTEKGRKAIASMAFKIARTKTAIDDAGKKLNEEARAKINAVDASRRKIRERFDALKDEVRAPLDKWEAEQAKKQERAEEQMARLMDIDLRANFGPSARLRTEIADIKNETFDPAIYGEESAGALTRKQAATLDLLNRWAETFEKQEAEAAELARLRAEKEERERQDAERKAAEERAEAERRAAEERKAREEEEKRQAEEARKREEERRKAEQERIEREARERAEAEARARVEAAERAAREAEEAAARKIEEERQAREREKAEQERVERELREADAKRQADREHRAKIMGAAKAAIMEVGIEEQQAKDIVLAIAAGNVPHVSIKF
ncbi:hypothetical protein [Sinorhizobium sojae]|uniref:hypothetical protein n=1 Tax=Sinorhizobium sojae TaxID=716925 RepID=UPI0004ADBC9D|nr:hypothetical protein [Sinorhizobium sojae]